MGGGEQAWVVGCGALGLALMAGGSLVTQAPRADEPTADALARLADRRPWVIGGSLATITGSALLLWPLAAVATASGPSVWPSLGAFSLVVWLIGFGLLVLGALLTLGVVWRTDGGPRAATARVMLDLGHLATWSASAPVAGIAVCATTAVGLQAGLVGRWVVIFAVAKVLTVLVEVAGIGSEVGWNAGGWAFGSSGYATVAWFAAVIVALA